MQRSQNGSHVRMILEPDKQWFRSRDGKHLVAGSPLTSFTVSDAGARILDDIENAIDLNPGHERLTSRLIATGAAHERITEAVDSADITVVIPAFARDQSDHERVHNLVNSLSDFTVIVVDDCSPLQIDVPGAQVVRHDVNRGPSASRNTGLSLVTTPFVAFIDVDAHATASDVCLLASALAHESVVLVAPRIRSSEASTGLSEYESFHSPLDLGGDAAVVRPLSRVSYVPATVAVAQTQRLRDVGAFDEDLRLGEDVDVVWRVAERGLLVRYIPSVECTHEPRSTWRQFVRQRFSYGLSAAALDQRHPYVAAPLRSHVLMVVLAASILSGYLYLAALIAVPVFAFFAFTLRTTQLPLRVRLTITQIGALASLRLLATAIRRAWWPIFIVASFFSVRATAMYTFSLFTPLMFGIVRNKPRAVASYVGLRILDDLAYGAGVWVGVIRERSPRCLVPVLTVRRTTQH